jgi:hypothetical protein
MKKMFSILFALSMSIGFAVVSLAQTSGITERQKHQQKRINKGAKSGELTLKEIFQLETEQVKIQDEKKDAKADGVVTNRERAGILKDQFKASGHIFRAKHNNKERGQVTAPPPLAATPGTASLPRGGLNIPRQAPPKTR